VGGEREAIVAFDAIAAEFCSRQILHTHIPVGTLTSHRCIFSLVGGEREAIVTIKPLQPKFVPDEFGIPASMQATRSDRNMRIYSSYFSLLTSRNRPRFYTVY